MTYFLVYILGFFLLSSVIFYCLFAGADFGAGIVESLCGKKIGAHRALIKQVMGPVWEANHVWLILVVVILFTAFPALYSLVSTIFHIPLTLVLLGIIVRGCAFTFRHYDAIKDENSQRWYSYFFVVSSYFTPLILGTVVGALFLGRAQLEATSFLDQYVWSWVSFFSFSVGAFVTSMFAYIASSYLIGETQDRELKTFYIKRAKQLNTLMVLLGAGVFFFAYYNDTIFYSLFITSPLNWVCVGLATLIHGAIWRLYDHSQMMLLRLCVASQMVLVILAWANTMFPVGVYLSDGVQIDIFSSAAPDNVLIVLTYCLGIGLLLVIPSLGLLYHVFLPNKTKQ